MFLASIESESELLSLNEAGDKLQCFMANIEIESELLSVNVAGDI